MSKNDFRESLSRDDYDVGVDLGKQNTFRIPNEGRYLVVVEDAGVMLADNPNKGDALYVFWKILDALGANEAFIGEEVRDRIPLTEAAAFRPAQFLEGLYGEASGKTIMPSKYKGERAVIEIGIRKVPKKNKETGEIEKDEAGNVRHVHFPEVKSYHQASTWEGSPIQSMNAEEEDAKNLEL